MRSVSDKLPLFCSEWGTSTYTGGGTLDFNNGQAWLDLMAGQNPGGQKISWCNWTFSDAGEASAGLNQGACNSQQWNNTSPSGTWVKGKILNPADSWASGGTTPPTTPTNQAPTVALTSPANSATFAAPATVAITANASDADGTVARVEFFNGSNKLGERTAAPYTFNWANVTAGQYTITAKATDNSGATTTSAAVAITVKAPTSTTTAPPPTGTGDLLGPDCIRPNDVQGYALNANLMANATAFSWWVNGSSQSITPTQPGQASISFGPYYTGGQVCVGVNYSAAPWYRQICKSVTVCTGGRSGC